MGHSELRQQKLKVNVIVAREVKSVVGERVDFVILSNFLSYTYNLNPHCLGNHSKVF